MNHATKLFMTQVLNLLCEGFQAVYVFDGPGRPISKRGKPRPNLQSLPPYVPPPAPNHPSRVEKQERAFEHVVDRAVIILGHKSRPRLRHCGVAASWRKVDAGFVAVGMRESGLNHSVIQSL